MATTGGANIAVDGLVFGYDTGYPLVSGNLDTYKFNLGKPTVNLLEQSGASSLDVRTDIYGNVTKLDLGGGKYRFENDGTGGTTIRLLCNVNDLTNGNIYGCSISYENFNPGVGTSVTLDWCDINNTSFSVGTYGTSGRIFISASRGTYDNTYRFFDISIPVSSSIDLFDAQVEAQTPTPFTTGTRSVSGSLIDLTRTTDIDLSNVSFDSNAQMTFDGTDDYIPTGTFNMGTPTDITLECVIRFNGTLDSNDRKVMHYDKTGTTNAVFQLRKGTTNSQLMYQAHNGVQWYTMADADAIEADTWAHFIITHAGTSGIMYKNGVQSSTATMGNLDWTNANNILIGHRAASEYWKGDIPVIKIYNRALTPQEVLQNYNALKERFSL